MKRSEYRGFAQVFRFTFLQAVRSKSLVITTLLMVCLALLSFPVLNRNKTIKADYESPVQKVYVINHTDIKAVPFAEALQEENGYGKVNFEETDKEKEELTAQISEEHSDEVILELSLDMETGGYLFEFYSDPESSVETYDVSVLAELLTDWFEKYKVSILDADDATLDMVGKTVDYTVLDSGEFLKTDEHDIISNADYNVVYAFMMIAYMVILMASNMVASKVVEEKANRIVEYLMTTVRPMALILGKVIAMLTVTVGEIALVALAGVASSKISNILYGTSSLDTLSGFLSADALKSLSVPNVLLCIVMIAIGILIYGLLAGMFGASVSKMEEIQQGMKVYTFIVLIAFFASIAASEMMWTVGINGFVKFAMVFPFTSVMIMPGAILIGKVSALMIIAAVLIQIITAVVVLKIVSSIYETIIVMNGNPIGVKQMFEIFRRN